MLQQTRAEVVIPYYKRCLKRFPDAGTLAQAKEADVLACWSGLGYYSRARNLQAAARAITATEGFPRDYASLRALPGVGPYTAAAVSSIAFDQPCAVLDGNVQRVDGNVRVSLQLVNVRDGATVWTATINEESKDLLRLQDSVAAQVIVGLSLKLGNTILQA